MNVLLINQPLNNRGDESAHKAFLRSLCKEVPDIRIRVLFVDDNDESIKQFNVGIPQVEYIKIQSSWSYKYGRNYYLKIHRAKWLFYVFSTMKEIWDNYLWSDIVVCAPGGICMGGFQNWLHIFFLLVAKTSKRPLAYYGRSIGPFPTKTRSNMKFKAFSIELMNYFSFFALRDKMSLQIASDLGFKGIPTVDTAFLDSPNVQIPSEIISEIGNNRWVVFVPNHLIWHYAFKKYTYEDVVDFFCSILNILSQKYPSHKIVMLPQTFTYVSNNKELSFFNDIKDRSKNEQLMVLPDYYSSDIQQALIAGSDLLVGARYHSIVFALNNNIPCVALSYEHKIKGMLESIRMTNLLCDITHALDSEESINGVLMRIGDIINLLPEKLNTKEIAEKEAKDCFELFVNYLRDLNE